MGNDLLAKALEGELTFEPNSAAIQASGLSTVQSVAHVLRSFAEFPVRCEGHAKGQPAENNDAKVKLSQARADAVKTALLAEGVVNTITTVGIGCAQGLGMRVRMYSDEVAART